jgi:hypothetical protein
MIYLSKYYLGLSPLTSQLNLGRDITLLNFRNGLTVFQIPPQRQASNVVCNMVRQFTPRHNLIWIYQQ